MSATVTHTAPELCSYGEDLSRNWFVYFDITNHLTGETKRKQFRGGINYSRDLGARKKAGNALKKVWAERLLQGWNPWGIAVEEMQTDLSRLTFNKSLDFALDKCKVSTGTRRAYKTTVDFIKQAAISLQLSQVLASSMSRQRIKLLLEHCQRTHKWTGVGYNKHLGYLHALLGRLQEWEIMEYNPADKITTQAVAETQKFVPLTKEEKEKIQEHLFIHHYPFYTFLMMLYHTGIRPKEILALKISDIDLITQRIKILPDLQAENSKTKSIRNIPINNHLMPFLREMQLEQYDPSCFIFGSPASSGRGNRGRGKAGSWRHEYFLPSPVRIKRDTVTKLWKKIIWTKLGIKKYCYCLKHTGGDDKILSGLDLDALRELYGHSSKFMTEKYASKLKEIYRERIMNNSPDFCTQKSPG